MGAGKSPRSHITLRLTRRPNHSVHSTQPAHLTTATMVLETRHLPAQLRAHEIDRYQGQSAPPLRLQNPAHNHLQRHSSSGRRSILLHILLLRLRPIALAPHAQQEPGGRSLAAFGARRTSSRASAQWRRFRLYCVLRAHSALDFNVDDRSYALR